MGYRGDIDGLRALAVVAVLLYHFGFISGGFVGVDIFFVISGYLITKIINETTDFSFSSFYVRRARRLLPACIAVITATLVIASFMLQPPALKAASASAVWATIPVSNLYFWLDSGYFADAAFRKPLLHTWSLGVEWQFYLVWPAFLIAIASQRRKIALMIAVGAISIFGAECLVRFNKDTTAFYLTPFRVFEFCLGAFVVWAERTSWPRPAIEACVLISYPLMLIPALLYKTSTPFPGLTALIPTVGAALFIFGAQSAATAAPLRHSVAKYIGLRSYSIYLVHWPLIVLYSYPNGRLSGLEALVIAAATLLAAEALYRWIETPFRTRKFMPIAATLGLAVSLTFAVFFWKTNGMAFRFNADIQRALANIGDQQKRWQIEVEKTFSSDERLRVFVYGNSFAIDIYDGLKQFENLEVIYSGTTHYGCVAFFQKSSDVSPECTNRNKLLISNSDIANADIIVLNEAWQPYRGTEFYQNEISSVIEFIRQKNSHATIVLVGPRMTFNRKVTDIITSVGTLDDLSTHALKEAAHPLSYYRAFDAKMTDWAARIGVSYFSPIDTLCVDTCRVLTGTEELIYFDEGHFTLNGAKLLGELMITSRIFSDAVSRAVQ